jgi:hypothetical protein
LAASVGTAFAAFRSRNITRWCPVLAVPAVKPLESPLNHRRNCREEPSFWPCNFSAVAHGQRSTAILKKESESYFLKVLLTVDRRPRARKFTTEIPFPCKSRGDHRALLPCRPVLCVRIMCTAGPTSSRPVRPRGGAPPSTRSGHPWLQPRPQNAAASSARACRKPSLLCVIFTNPHSTRHFHLISESLLLLERAHELVENRPYYAVFSLIPIVHAISI